MRKRLLMILAPVLFLAAIFGIAGVKRMADNQESIASIPETLPVQSRIDSGETAHDLPLVSIETYDRPIDKESDTWVRISVIDHPGGGNFLSDTPEQSAAALINHRGASSYNIFDKKQYHIEFHPEEGDLGNLDLAVMGMGEGSDWVLNGPFLDRTLLRNHLIYSISRQILDWAPETRLCEVYLDGEYQGVYVMIESIKNDPARLDLTDYGLLSGRTAYILKRDRDNTEECLIQSYGLINGYTSYQMSIIYPKAENLTEDQQKYICDDISRFEEALYSDYFDDPNLGYAAYIDVDNFVDYYIINEFTMNSDASYLSTYIYKDAAGKIRMTVWDYNNAFNNYMWDDKPTDEFLVAESNWYNRLFQDKAFTDKVIARYIELRQGVLSEDALLAQIDEYILTLGDAIDRNFEVWGYTFYEGMLSDDEQGNSRDPGSYDEAIAQLKECIRLRGEFLDSNIQFLYQFAIN